MPNRTIYISDTDLPIFEKAQQMAGNNLSATIVQALRRFIEMQEQKVEGFKTIKIKTGKSAYTEKQFVGRLLAKGRFAGSDKHRYETIEIFQTQKNNIALYVRNVPDWSSWSRWSGEEDDWSHNNWGSWNDWKGEYKFEVFPSLAELKERVPEELYQAAEQNLNHGPIETLDI